MYAIVDIAGHQFRIAENERLRIPALKQEKGATVTFDRVLLLAGDREIHVGNPTVPGASVQATVLDHGRGEKVMVFKKKRRKGYRVKRGHRQAYTDIQVTKIGM